MSTFYDKENEQMLSKSITEFGAESNRQMLEAMKRASAFLEARDAADAAALEQPQPIHQHA